MRSRGADEDHAALRRLVHELQRERAARGLTQAALAKMMGVSQATVSQFENEISDPHLLTLQRYAHALGMVITFELRPDSTADA